MTASTSLASSTSSAEPSFRIDPALPICWEDLETLRIGFEHAVVRLRRPTVVAQRIISAFREGMPLSNMLRYHYGASPVEWSAIVETLAPALVSVDAAPGDSTSASAASTQSLVVPGETRGAHLVRAALSSIGWQVRDDVPSGATSEVNVPAPLAQISVEQFVEAPAILPVAPQSQLPQLPVKFTDQSVWIGPILMPGATPCAECVLRADTVHEPALPVLGAQLVDAVPATLTPAAVTFTAAVIGALVERFFCAPSTPRTHDDEQRLRLERGRLRYAVHSGVPDVQPEYVALDPHLACASCDENFGYPACAKPASARNLEGVRETRKAPALPESRKLSRARVRAT